MIDLAYGVFVLSGVTSLHKRLLVAGILFCFSLVIYRAFNVDNFERKSLYGDGYSDINTHSAILFFNDFGFLNSYFLV